MSIDISVYRHTPFYPFIYNSFLLLLMFFYFYIIIILFAIGNRSEWELRRLQRLSVCVHFYAPFKLRSLNKNMTFDGLNQTAKRISLFWSVFTSLFYELTIARVQNPSAWCISIKFYLCSLSGLWYCTERSEKIKWFLFSINAVGLTTNGYMPDQNGKFPFDVHIIQSQKFLHRSIANIWSSKEQGKLSF